MKEYPILTLPALLQRSVEKYGNRPVVSFVNETPLTYNEFENRRRSVTCLLEKLKIQPGDRVALLSSNSPNWGITYFAIASMGAVVVPILPDFSVNEIENVLIHSESKAIFVSQGLKPKIENFKQDSLLHRILVDDFSILETNRRGIRFKEGKEPAKEYQVAEDDLAVIIYTSGTTGKSKGVMLTHKNLISNAIASRGIQEINSGDRFLSVLPLSHTYENTIGFILPIICGSSIFYIKKPPTPSVLLPALKTVRPTLMLTVPLIIEKIYRNKVLPSFNKSKLTRTLYAIPALRKKFNQLAGKKLMRTFGGELKFFGIGGAKLDKTVEKFLREAKFPYAIGYGLTETTPVSSGNWPGSRRLGSIGKEIPGVRIDIDTDVTGDSVIGELVIHGPNVMMGYYNLPEENERAFTADRGFRSGDLGYRDEDGFIFIRGRIKEQYKLENGKYVVPSPIEEQLQLSGYVMNIMVYGEQRPYNVAVIVPDMEALTKWAKKHGLSDLSEDALLETEEVSDLYQREIDRLSSEIKGYEKVRAFVLEDEEFAPENGLLTPSLKVKRRAVMEKYGEDIEKLYAKE